MRRLAAAGAMRLSLLLSGRVEDEVFARYPQVLATDVSPEEVTAIEEMLRQEQEGRISRFVRFCGDNVVLWSLLELLMLRLLEDGAAPLLELVSPGNGEGVTLLTAARAAGYTGMLDEAIPDMRAAAEIAGFLFGSPRSGEKDFYRVAYGLDEYLLGFFSEGDWLDRAFAEFAQTWTDDGRDIPCYGMEEEVEALAARLRACRTLRPGQLLTVLIGGERESGRFTAARAVAQHEGLPLLAVEFSYLTGTEEPKEVMRRLVRSCALEDRALVVRNISPSTDTIFLIERLQTLYGRHCGQPLFLLAQPEVKLVPVIRGDCLTMRIPTGSQAALALWRGFLPEEEREMAESLASKMTLTAGQVQRVVRGMETARIAGERVDERMICRLCYEVLDDGRYDNVKRVEPGFNLEDVRIDDHNRAILMDICHQVELRHQVYDGWGLRKRYAYGRCVSVILAGPPGTGKTMTVHALAGQLGLELYKVDLSQVVDKYVGETEKRLEEVFARAQKSNMILFFDEADAVMSKRSEVKDAKDKYANTEVSFILQRIEEYDGIVLLATNNLQNIDNAFMRRIRYVLNFQMPDRQNREEIWRSAFGQGVPLAEDIDYPFLAERFELSGGDIKNIVLNAVFYGAAEGEPVAMRHIMKAVYRENTKTRRIAFEGDYGGYAYLLHD
ncbi:MAG: ATP-binding protein [Butyrivibrio sp.]|nr:ATP-binding protein [Butyrivibrio sp.]